MRFLLGSLALVACLATTAVASAQSPPQAGWYSSPPYLMPLPMPIFRPVRPEVRSLGMIAAGSLVLSFGATLVATGASIVALGGTNCIIFVESGGGGAQRRAARERVGTAQAPLSFDCGNHAGLGIGFVIAGNIIAPAGVPLLVVGASRSSRQKSRALPEVSLGASSGSLRWVF